MLGDAEPVIDRAVAAGRIETRGRAQLAAGRRRSPPRWLPANDAARRRSAPRSRNCPVAALADERLVDQPLGDDDMRDRIEDRDIGSGLQRQMIVGLDVRAPDQFDAARIDDDETRAGAQALLQARGKNRMGVGRIGADHDHDVRFIHRLEILRAGRSAEGLRQPVAGRRMANARAGVDVVVAEPGANHLLNQEHFLVGAARGADGADRVAAVLRLDAPEFVRRVGDRLVPGDFAPRDPRSARGSSASECGPCASRSRRRTGP